jgi:NTE family protein
VTSAPRIGLVLGAGGVIGHAFHAGVLDGLCDATGWDPRDAEVIVGTSAGSVVGALLRAGFSARDLAARSTGDPVSPEGARLAGRAGMGDGRARFPTGPTRRRGLPRMASPSLLMRAALRPFWMNRPGVMLAGALPAGAVPTELVAAAFRPLFGSDWPEQNLWLTAVRLRDGNRVVFGRPGAPPASVADAIAASCAIPSFFEPVTIGGVEFVDGGAHSPTNADVLVDYGSLSQAPAPATPVGKAAGSADHHLDLVVVSSPMSVAGNRLRPSLDLPARRLCRFYLGQEAARIRRRGVPVLAFQPTGDDLNLMGMNAMDPGRRGPVTKQARASTLKKLERDDVQSVLSLLHSGTSTSASGRPPREIV